MPRYIRNYIFTAFQKEAPKAHFQFIKDKLVHRESKTTHKTPSVEEFHQLAPLRIVMNNPKLLIWEQW